MDLTPHMWPWDRLAQELRKLNREFFHMHPDSRFAGLDSWPNQQPERFAEEFADAKSHGINAISVSDAAFLGLMQIDARFNWAVALDGSLTVSPSIVITSDGPVRISHAILVSGGEAVLAAGEGRPNGFLSNTTGHYKNEAFVVPPVREAFAAIGMVFKR